MYDAIIVGAGPGGATAAAALAQAGLHVLLLDKSRFPRSKVCGDAICAKSAGVLHRLGLAAAIRAADQAPIRGVTLGGPSGDVVPIPYAEVGVPGVPLTAYGFACAREVFDLMLFEHAALAGAEVWEGVAVGGLLRDGGRVVGVRVWHRGRRAESLRARVVIGADGAYSIAARELGLLPADQRHCGVGLRAYYEGVADLHGHVELHFVGKAVPGYFWIVPMTDGRANVGVGMRAGPKRSGERLRHLLAACIEHPRFRHRFAHARRIGPPRGWGLPLGSKPRPMAGAGWMLVGDAAGLVDPFTGEGIGNAMIAGEHAAAWAAHAAEVGDASAALLRGYEAAVLGSLRSELKLSDMMQRMTGSRWLVNAIIRKAGRSAEAAGALTRALDHERRRHVLASPAFYLQMLTA